MAPNWMSCRILFMLFGVRTDSIYLCTSFFKKLICIFFLVWYFRICFPCTCPCVCPSGTVMCMPCCWEMDEIFHNCPKCHHKMNGFDLLEIGNDGRRIWVQEGLEIGNVRFYNWKNVFWYDFLSFKIKQRYFLQKYFLLIFYMYFGV